MDAASPSEVPSWRLKLAEARAAALASLTDDEREMRALAQSAAVIAGRQRKAKARARAAEINGFALDGLKPLEIALRLGLSVSKRRSHGGPSCGRLNTLKHLWGLIIEGRPGFRRLFAWIPDDSVAALEAMAADMGTSRGVALETLLKLMLCEDAFIARRTLRVQRKIVA